MILKPLSAVHPTCNWNDPQLRSSNLGTCATQYFFVTKQLQTDFTFSLYLQTLITNMHLAFELAVKAIATKTIDNFEPAKFGHQTSRKIKIFAHQVDAFKELKSEENSMDFIRQLEKGFVSNRYGEQYISLGPDDHQLFQDIFIRLIDKLHAITQVKFIPQHFKT